MTDQLSHLDESGKLRMVDVGGKDATRRRAVAEGFVVLGEKLLRRILDEGSPKGNVFEAARLAGIMAAKKTSELIPLCHPLPLDHVLVALEPLEDRIRITAEASVRASTGVEMEALTAVSVAALTVYDMLKALSRSITIEAIRLVEKSGGKSGDYHA